MEVLLAQTNLQLYTQLRQSGFSSADIQTVQKDYETACLLFAPLCRSTGRPFLCHAVGTASAALKEGADLLDVRAALLHAAYKHGRFPDHKKGRTQRHAAWIQERCGTELADLLAAFSQFGFTPKHVEAFLHQPPSTDEQAFRLVRLKLANDVDDSHAFGAALGHKTRYQDETWFGARVALSQKMGFPFFASAFSQAIAECGDAAWLDTTTVFAKRGYIRSIPGQLLSKARGRSYI